MEELNRHNTRDHASKEPRVQIVATDISKVENRNQTVKDKENSHDNHSKAQASKKQKALSTLRTVLLIDTIKIHQSHHFSSILNNLSLVVLLSFSGNLLRFFVSSLTLSSSLRNASLLIEEQITI